MRFLEVVSPPAFSGYFRELPALIPSRGALEEAELSALAGCYGLELDLAGLGSLLERYGLWMPGRCAAGLLPSPNSTLMGRPGSKARAGAEDQKGMRARFVQGMSAALSCLLLLAGCGGGGSAPPAAAADFVVLVDRASSQPDERFVVRLVTPEQIAAARAMVSGQRPRQIVFGNLADGGGGFNRDPASGQPWSWHLIPGSVTFVDVTAEIYDGAPSTVERDKAEYLRLGRYGPWGSRVERELP